ncbi:hypothetical protein CDAR_464881 [Caerostris darwini]|uniref:Uncharacterized protein n=1 Tax=Caerostris darwini TaxID=1538125 RepID=A0AAV4QJ02_9ARAC|nr:hypothetical protein CDAR_464881 [Caerostris darwini]
MRYNYEEKVFETLLDNYKENATRSREARNIPENETHRPAGCDIITKKRTSKISWTTTKKMRQGLVKRENIPENETHTVQQDEI